MAKLRLTDTWLSAVTDAGDYSDTIESCLKVRVARTGAKTFSAVRKLGGKTVRVRIGAYPEIGLRDTRIIMSSEAMRFTGVSSDQPGPVRGFSLGFLPDFGQTPIPESK